MMKNKERIKKEAKPKQFSVNDSVLTPISDRRGVIIKIEEVAAGNHTWYSVSTPAYKEYTVKVRLPHRKLDLFKDVIVLCQDSELEA